MILVAVRIYSLIKNGANLQETNPFLLFYARFIIAEYWTQKILFYLDKCYLNYANKNYVTFYTG